MGYHDCPPHPCEVLDPDLDAKWVRDAELSARELETALRNRTVFKVLDLVGKRYF